MAAGAATLEWVVIGWAVLLGLLLVALWLYGGRRRAVTDSYDVSRLPERRFNDRRRTNVGPPPDTGERRSGIDRRHAAAAT